MNEKENARVLGPRLQRRSFPASKSPSPQVPKQAPLFRLALARRPLRDTKNVIKESSRQAPPAALTSAEGSRKYGWENVKQSAVTCNRTVFATGQTGRLVSQAFKGGVDSQPHLSLAENEEGEVSCEGERFPSASSLLGTQKLLPELLNEAAPFYEGHPASGVMNRTEGPFFPSLQEESQEGEGEESGQKGVIQQGGESVPLRPGSVHASLKLKRLEPKHHKCLTPIFEVSPVKEGEAAGGDAGRIAALYQNFFAEDCAVVIDNIRRTSYQEVLGGGFPAESSTDTLDIPNIKEESLPTCNYLNTSLEDSAGPLESDVPRCDASFLPLNLDGKRCTDKSEEKQGGNIVESRGCNLTFILEDDLSVLMGETQSIHQSEASESLLENMYNLRDQEGDLGTDVLEGRIQNLTVESGRSLDAKAHSKEDISADVNSNGTYVLQSDGPDAGPTVTGEVKEQSADGWDARSLAKTSSSNCNDTYELQPKEERGRVRVDCREGGGTEKLNPGSPQREIVADSPSDHSVNGVEKGMLSLENTLELTDNFLVTSTPMPALKLPGLTKEIDSDPSEVCRQLMVADSVNMCSQATVDGVDGDVPSFQAAALPLDGADRGESSFQAAALPVDGADGGGSSFHPAALPVDGADGGGSSRHPSGIPLVAVKVAVPNPPVSAAPAPRQDAASCRLNVPLRRRSLLPPSSGLRNSKAAQPLARPASSRRLSLPATAKSLAGRKVPGAGAHGSYGNKTEAASRSAGKQPEASVEASSVLELSKEKSTVAEGKLPAGRHQRPRASGIPAPSSCTSRQGLRVPARVEDAELKRIPAPPTGQKRPYGGPRESLSLSKQKRVDVPMGQALQVGRTSGLQRPTAARKDLKANADTSPCSSGGTLKESCKRALAAQGPRKLAARVGAFDTNPSKAACSLERSALQAGQLVPSVTDRPAPEAGAESTQFARTAACEAVAEVAIKHTDCQDCVRYREEINRLRSALRALTAVVE